MNDELLVLLSIKRLWLTSLPLELPLNTSWYKITRSPEGFNLSSHRCNRWKNDTSSNTTLKGSNKTFGGDSFQRHIRPPSGWVVQMPTFTTGCTGGYCYWTPSGSTCSYAITSFAENMCSTNSSFGERLS